jgi:pimeloyl-ACP methyl ester carboxylesterase
MNAPAPPKPSAALLAMEGRALFEMGAFLASSPLLRAMGRGDQHPVLVLPGFTANDRSTGALRGTLRSQGYWTHGWGLGRNLGPTPEVVEGLFNRLVAVHERHGRKVSVVGWSLGGMYARAMARALPDMVRQVITLGSPFRLREGGDSNVSRLYEQVSGRHVERTAEAMIPEHELPPLPVPTTAIYTRTDGVVHWSNCIEAEGPSGPLSGEQGPSGPLSGEQGPFRENIEVTGSHSGLGHNPAVLYAVADRLHQPEDDWRPFHPPAWMRQLYPRPVWWTLDR